MARNKKMRMDSKKIQEPENISPDRRIHIQQQGKENRAEDIFEGDTDTLDEGSAMNFEVVEITPNNGETPAALGEEPGLMEEVPINFLINRDNSPDPGDEITRETDDEGIKEEFRERQSYAQGTEELLTELEEHHHLSPELSGGDVDAAWEYADQAGEETVGGSVPTPDQSVVDDLGKGAGLTYRDDEELDYDKVLRRDQNRWELNPASANDRGIDPGHMLDDEFDMEIDDETDEESDQAVEEDFVMAAGVRGAGESDELFVDELDDEDEDEDNREDDLFDDEEDDEL